MSKQCNNCGAMMDDEDLFCDSCGTAYKEEGTVKSTSNNPFFEIEEQLSQCQSVNEIDVIRERIEREYDDARDRNYLLGIVDTNYNRLKDAVQKGVIDAFENMIESCNTLDDAFALRDRIINADISHSDKYSLMRKLKVKTTRQNSAIISKGLKLDVSDRLMSFSVTILFIIAAAMGYPVYKFVPIHWISVVGKWWMYVMLAFGALFAIWFVVCSFRWIFASEEQKNASRLFDTIKVKELYFNEKDYIIHDSDVRYLRSDEISGKGSDWIYKAKFEIYARHGKKFDSETDAVLNSFFSGKAWYVHCPARKVNESDLNKYEVANYKLLSANKNN